MDVPNKFTGNKDVDFTILNMLDDRELGKVCQVNKYAKSLCENEIFWINRFEKKFGKILKIEEVRKEFNVKDWKTFYINFVTQLAALEGYLYTDDYDRYTQLYGKGLKLIDMKEREEDYDNDIEDEFYVQLFNSPIMTKYFAKLSKTDPNYRLLYELFSNPSRFPTYIAFLRDSKGLDEKNMEHSYAIVGDELHSPKFTTDNIYFKK
jgi:hypothetical protein